MSKIANRLAAALIAVACVAGTAGAQAPAQVGEPVIAAEVKPKHGGPHPDPPNALKALACPRGWKRVPPGVNPALRCLPGHLLEHLHAPSNSRVASFAAQSSCPAGWQPVVPERNPVLRCQPANRVTLRVGTSNANPAIGCPAGWRPVSPEMNPILRCLPDELAAKPAPDNRRRPPPGCPQGWKAVPPEVNPLMRCLPGGSAARSGVQPQRIGPDPGEPVARPDP